MAQIILDSNSNLIQGDFDSATVNNRTKLQTSTTNATTGVYVVPNGSATSASVQMANAADPTNASKIVVATNGSTDTQIVSGANGTGTYLPLSFYTNNDIRFQMGTAGQLNVRTAPGTVSSGTAGQVLTSGGPGAGVSWATAGQLQTQLFTAPGTWTNPGTVTQVRVTVVGGGGGGGAGPTTSAGKDGGYGGLAVASFSIPTSPVSVTVGSGGAGFYPGSGSGGTGGSSSFGPYISATGGAGGGQAPAPVSTPGTGTISAPAIPGALKATGINNAGPVLGLIGIVQNTPPATPGGALAPATPYSYTGPFQAGSIGSGGPGTLGGTGAIGGAVLVEFIG